MGYNSRTAGDESRTKVFSEKTTQAEGSSPIQGPHFQSDVLFWKKGPILDSSLLNEAGCAKPSRRSWLAWQRSSASSLAPGCGLREAGGIPRGFDIHVRKESRPLTSFLVAAATAAAPTTATTT